MDFIKKLYFYFDISLKFDALVFISQEVNYIGLIFN